MEECICPGNQPTCPKCGRKWEWCVEYSDGKKIYFSEEVYQKYLALYGAAAAKGHRKVEHD